MAGDGKIYMMCILSQKKQLGGNTLELLSFFLGKPQWYLRTLKEPYGQIHVVKNGGCLPKALPQPVNHVGAPS